MKFNLYRVATSDHICSIANGCSEKELISEALSHELSAKTKRRILFSFTFSARFAQDYRKLQQKRGIDAEIYYIKIDSEKLPKELKLIPACTREFWYLYLAKYLYNSPDNYITNPASSRKHSTLAILQPGRRSVSSLAYSSREIMVYTSQELKLNKVDDIKSVDKTQPRQEEIFSELKALLPHVSKKEKLFLNDVIKKLFRESNNKNPYLITKFIPMIMKSN